MSAICGLFRPSGMVVRAEEVGEMLSRLAHRGPDGLFSWHLTCVGLGQALLRTTLGSQQRDLPLQHTQAQVVIAADAWLANREDLARELGIDAATLRSLSDGALILQAYLAFGQRCPEHLLGDFSFCIWDGRERGLYCARDVQGVKPFYYYASSQSHVDLFAFGTEIKAILALEQVPAEINELRIAENLVGLIDDGTQTSFEAIRTLPASHALWVDARGLRTWRYWTWDPDYETRLLSDDAYDEAFREQFERAVKACMRTDYPLGAFLSGGLDSSSIVCQTERLRQRSGSGQLHTFSAMFNALPDKYRLPADESEYIQSVLAQTDTCWHPLPIHTQSSFDDIERMLWHTEELPFGPNLYLHRAIYQAARDAGVRVILDGIDGDTTISHGLERLPELFQQGRWPTLAREIRALAKTRGVSASHILWGNIVRPLAPQGVVEVWRNLRGHQIPLWGPKSLISPDFAVRSGLAERIKAANARSAAGPHSARREHMASIETPIYPILFQMADKAAGAVGVESRYPFFDRDLLAFCLSLPADQKLRDGWPRAILRRAMKGILPDKVATRTTKGNLGTNLCYQLHTHQRDRIERWAGADGERLAPYVDLAAFRRTLELFHAAPLHHQAEAEQLYWASSLGLWLEMMEHNPRLSLMPTG